MCLKLYSWIMKIAGKCMVLETTILSATQTQQDSAVFSLIYRS